MAEHISAFVPDGIDPLDEQAARRAALDCIDAVGQLLETANLQRSGTLVTENAIVRCLYDVDCAVANAGHFRACNPTFPSSRTAPYAEAAKLATMVRSQWMKAVVEWKNLADAPSDGWSCLWHLYEQQFRNSVGPTWADALASVEKSDADEQGLINTTRFYIPQEALEHQWHFGAWPFVCEQLKRFASTDLTALAQSLLELNVGTVEQIADLANKTPTKAKRSTARGEGRAKLIAALTKHHKYADGGCLNLEPIGNNELARLAGVSESTASAFFNNKFNRGEKRGYAKYRVICRNAGSLADSLKALNDEFSPHDLYGRRPADEGDRDDEE